MSLCSPIYNDACNLIDPYYNGEWDLLVERARGFDSVSEAVLMLRDEFYDHPIDDGKFWGQMLDIVNERDPEMAKDVFQDLVGFVFLVGLTYAPLEDFIPPAVSDEIRARALRLLMQDWDATAVDMSDIRPWELAPEIQVVVDEALNLGAKADRIYWLVQLLSDDDPQIHDMAALYIPRWRPAPTETETLHQIEQQENKDYSGKFTPRLTERLLAAIARRNRRHAALSMPKTETGVDTHELDLK